MQIFHHNIFEITFQTILTISFIEVKRIFSRMLISKIQRARRRSGDAVAELEMKVFNIHRDAVRSATSASLEIALQDLHIPM